MKTKFTLSIILLSLFFIYEKGNAQAPSWVWTMGATGANYDEGKCISKDVNGNVYTAGYFTSPTIKFGNITLTNNGSCDIFIVKYNSSGNLLWARSAGGTGYDYVNSLKVDANGNSFITGYFHSPSVTFGSTTLSNAGAGDIFIVKYDSSGNAVWARSEGGSNSDIAKSIDIDPGGNLYITGYFLSSSINFGSISLTNGNGGTGDIFIAKYNSAGTILWAKSATGADEDMANGIAVDGNGNSYITGYFTSAALTIDGSTLTNPIGHFDFFIIRFNASGNVLWAQSATAGISNSAGNSITVDAQGDALITGEFGYPSVIFAGITLSGYGSNDVFIAKYNTSGNITWAKNAGSIADESAKSIAVDAPGNFYITGNFYGDSVLFDNISIKNKVNFGTSDIFIAKYNASGNALWATSVGDTSNDFAYGITIDAIGNTYITGGFDSDSILFGNTSLINSSPFLLDYLVAKLDNTGASGIMQPETINIKASIFPNPTTDKVIITLTKPLPPNTTITITDMQGRVVNEVSKITPGGDAIDVSTLTQGVYLLKVNGQVQRFVKM